MDADGYEDFVDFENMRCQNIEKWIFSARKINFNSGGYYVSYAKEKRFQALEFWVNESLCIRREKSNLTLIRLSSTPSRLMRWSMRPTSTTFNERPTVM